MAVQSRVSAPGRGRIPRPGQDGGSESGFCPRPGQDGGSESGFCPGQGQDCGSELGFRPSLGRKGSSKSVVGPGWGVELRSNLGLPFQPGLLLLQLLLSWATYRSSLEVPRSS